MKKPVIGIVGFGFVGKAIYHGFKEIADFRIFDIVESLRQNTWEETWRESEFIFVCVPTPIKLEDEKIDLSIMNSVIDKGVPYCDDQIIIIKSTIVPGTVEKFIDKYPKNNFVFNPEFLTERNYKIDFENQSRIILGGNKQETIDKVEELYRLKFKDTKIWKVNVTAAQFLKYVSNCFLATKVSFFNEIYQICTKLGIDYEEVREMLLDDPRIGKSHTQVPGPDGELGYGGKCVLPSAKIKINGKVMNFEELHNNFNNESSFLTDSINSNLEDLDEKEITNVTKRKIEEKLLKFKTADGEFICTRDHLIPVLREKKKILVRASEIKTTDKLFVLRN